MKEVIIYTSTDLVWYHDNYSEEYVRKIASKMSKNTDFLFEGFEFYLMEKAQQDLAPDNQNGCLKISMNKEKIIQILNEVKHYKDSSGKTRELIDLFKNQAGKNKKTIANAKELFKLALLYSDKSLKESPDFDKFVTKPLEKALDLSVNEFEIKECEVMRRWGFIAHTFKFNTTPDRTSWGRKSHTLKLSYRFHRHYEPYIMRAEMEVCKHVNIFRDYYFCREQGLCHIKNISCKRRRVLATKHFY